MRYAPYPTKLFIPSQAEAEIAVPAVRRVLVPKTSQLLHRTHHAESNILPSEVRELVSFTVARTMLGRLSIYIATAPYNALRQQTRAVRWVIGTFWLVGLVCIVACVPVPAPFKHVTGHIIQPECIRCFLFYLVSFIIAIFIDPRVIAYISITFLGSTTIWQVSCRACSGCILPLCLGRKSIAVSCPIALYTGVPYFPNSLNFIGILCYWPLVGVGFFRSASRKSSL